MKKRSPPVGSQWASPIWENTGQCSSLKCSHAFKCEGLQKNHTSKAEIAQTFLQHFTEKKNYDIGRFVLNVKII